MFYILDDLSLHLQTLNNVRLGKLFNKTFKTGDPHITAGFWPGYADTDGEI